MNYKFRVWNKDELKFYYPSTITICNNGKSCWCNLKFIQNPIIQLYTGFFDRHGYEICEGDYIYQFNNIERGKPGLIVSPIYEVTYNILHGILLINTNKNEKYTNKLYLSYETYTICGNNCEDQK